MPKKKLNSEGTAEQAEDTTMYDEFISSFFSWVPSEVQRDKAREMEEPIED